MEAARNRRRSIVQLLAVGALAAGTGLIGIRTSHAAGNAGHWKAIINASCVNSPQNAKVCNEVFGGLKGVGVKGSTLNEQFTVNVTVGPNGKYTALGSGSISMSTPGAKLRGCPSASKFGTVLFTGTCPFASSYVGQIAGSKYGFPVFKGKTYTLTFNGKKIGTFKDTNSGLPSPAKVGRYTSAWAARIVGLKSAPAGFVFNEVVSR